MQQKITLSNLVYGDPYTRVFLDYHLRSVLENFRDCPPEPGSAYLIFSDAASIEVIQQHPHHAELRKYFRVIFYKLDFALDYEKRYGLQSVQLSETVKFTLANDSLMHFACADLYYGRHFFATAAARLEEHPVDAIFGHCFRSAMESALPCLDQMPSPSTATLFEIAFLSLHPLWLAANWDAPQFSRIPWHLLWSDESQIICRGFSVAALMVKPQPWMIGESGSTDISLPARMKNHYWVSDWAEMPLVEIGQLKAFYPPFGNFRASVPRVSDWARQSVLPENYENILKWQVLKAPGTPLNETLVRDSERIAREIVDELKKPRT